MANLRKCRRKRKRLINWYAKRVRRGSFVYDCRYHPCIVTDAYMDPRRPFDSSIEVVSLIDGKGSSCSMIYCGPEPISEDVAKEGARIAKEDGFDAFLVFRGFPKEAVDAHNELSKTWGWNDSPDGDNQCGQTNDQ